MKFSTQSEKAASAIGRPDANIYTSGEYWDNIPDYLAGQAPNKIRYLLRLIDFDALRKKIPGKTLSIVDIGCGAGMVSAGLAACLRQRYSDLEITVDGYDLSPRAIEIAQKRNPEGRFVCGDFRDAGRTWDLAVLCDVIEHVENPDAFLRAVAERARFFVVGFAMDDNLANRLDRARREHVINSGHVSLFDEKRALSLGRRYGSLRRHGYIDNAVSRTLKYRSLRGLFTLPLRLSLLLFSRRIKGKIFGGESLYVFAEAGCFKECQPRPSQ